jgi:penicillin-binding protein 1A
MARAFSIFANQGREVSPIAIRSVEDRNGKVVLDIERDIRLEQRRKGNTIQVISPQNAYVMTSILKKTVEKPGGTLYNRSQGGAKFTFKDERGKTFKMPMAGKTGTPQNWSDAWTVGFSPYYTTAIWFGFDKPGNSLGTDLTGATLAGPVWADYMREIHQGLPFRDFIRPGTGIVDITVCTKSGKIKTAACNEGEVTLPFLEGTQPAQFCDYHGNKDAETIFLRIEQDTLFIDSRDVLGSLSMPVMRDEGLQKEILEEERAAARNRQSSSRSSNSRTANSTPNSRNSAGSSSSSRNSLPSNPLLDEPPDDIPDSTPDVPGNSPGNDLFGDSGYGLELPAHNPLMD